jgi:hypothetical protein
VRVAVRCVEQLVAELGEPLAEDGLMKTMALLGWNHGPTSVAMGKGLNKYPPVEWSRKRGPLHAGRPGRVPGMTRVCPRAGPGAG